jgi:hypothetical protein
LQRSVSRKLKKWRNDQWNVKVEFLDPEDQSLWRMTNRVTEFPNPSPLVTTGGSLYQTMKAKALAENPETQFQPVTGPSARQSLRHLTWR